MNPKLSNEENLEKKLSVPESKMFLILQEAFKMNLIWQGGLPWETYRDSSGNYIHKSQNPKSQYLITYDPLSSAARIIKKDKGFWVLD